MTTIPGTHRWQVVDRLPAIKRPIPAGFGDDGRERWPARKVDARAAPAFGCTEEQTS